MNYLSLINLIGRLSFLMGALILIPVGVGMAWGDSLQDVAGFLYSSGVAFTLGALSLLSRLGNNREFGLSESFVCVTLGWVVVVLLGALPYHLSGSVENPTDAFFESMSGFTTTGASVLTNLNELSKGLLFWRCFSQWLGGMGIVVLFVALLPALGAGGNTLFQAEVPGPTAGRIKPRISDTAKVLYKIYLGLTLILIPLLALCGMSTFDAICHAFTTLATGGFSPNPLSIEAYSPSAQWVITVFMLLGGLNFAMYFLLLNRRFRKVLQNTEVRLYGAWTLAAIGLITVGLIKAVPASDTLDIELTLRHAAFQVASIMTSTGYSSTNYDQWPELCRITLLGLMFFGGCAGSTAGGMKLARLIILWKYWVREVFRLFHPNAVLQIKIQKSVVKEDVVAGTVGLFILFTAFYGIGVLIMTAMGENFETSVSAVVACLSNIGPGLGKIGPHGSFSTFPDLTKWFLSALMLLGRLEIYVILILFVPSLWKK